MANKEFIAENQTEWKEIGQFFKGKREKRNMTKAAMARNIGISPSTLTNFEEGEPVQSAKLIQRAYSMALKLRELTAKEEKEFISPSSWTDEEKISFPQILLTWMNANDHTYDFYKYLRSINDGNGIDSQFKSKSTVEFEKLFHTFLEEDADFYEEHYRKELKEYELYKTKQQLPREMIN